MFENVDTQTDASSIGMLHMEKKLREHLLCYACILWTKIFLRSDNVLTKMFH